MIDLLQSNRTKRHFYFYKEKIKYWFCLPNCVKILSSVVIKPLYGILMFCNCYRCQFYSNIHRLAKSIFLVIFYNMYPIMYFLCEMSYNKKKIVKFSREILLHPMGSLFHFIANLFFFKYIFFRFCFL